MALINCPDCQTEVSDQAAACPRCGHPIARTDTPKVPATASQVLDQKLNEAAAMARQRGGTMTVDSRSATEAIFTFTKTPNHVLHGVLTLLTAGLWLIVWLIVVFGGGHKETWKVTVNPAGEATVAQL